MGGPDPLDYVNMYANPGTLDGTSPIHWHYVTNGFSDLYGDSRIHSPAASPCGPSGFGFELTFRLRRDPSDLSPPTWPASLLQSLARYVFRANAQLRPGDHIPWHSPLDRPPHLNSQQHIQSGSGANNETKSVKLSCDKEAVVGTSKPSSIRHMLVVRDPQLKKIITPYGYVEFLQIVGLMDDELQLVQRWTGLRLAGLLRGESYRDVGIEAVGTAGHVVHNIDSADCPLLGTISSVAVSDSSAESAANLEASLSLGGPLLVTDMRRHSSLLVLRPGLAQLAEAAVTRQGSSLSGVTLRLLAWRAPPCSLKPSVSVGSNGGETGGAETTGSFSAKFDWIASLIPGELEAETQRRRTQSAKIHFEEPNSDRGLVDSDGDVAMTATSELGHSGPSVELGVMTVDDEFIDVVGDGDSLTTIYPSTIPATPAAGMSMRPGGSTWNTSAACEPNDTSTSNSTLSNHTPLNCFWPAYPSGLAPGTKHASGPGSAGSAPCTPLAQLSLSSPGATAAAASFSILDASRGRSSAGSSRGPSSIPTSAAEGSSTSLELVSDPTPAFRTWLSGADVWLDIEAARVLRLAVTDRLRHGRHFTFVDAQRPNCAVSLVPAGLPGSEVSASRPMCAQGNWLQIYIPDDFLSQIEADFAKCLPEPSHMDNLVLPVVFRWHKHCLRLCLVDSLPFDLEVAEKIPTIPIPSSTSNLSHPPLLSSSSPSTSVSCQPFSFCATKPVQSNVSRLLPPNQAGAGIRAIRCPETNANSDGIPVANSASESIRGSNSLISGSTPQIPRFLPGHIPPPAVLASWMGQMQTAPLPNQSAIVCSSTTPLSQPGPDHHHAHPHYPYQLIQPHAQQQQQQQTGSQPGLTLLGSGPESSLLSNRLLSRLPNLDSNISEAYSRPSTLDASLTTSKVPSAHGNDFVQSRPQGTPPKNVSTNVGYPPADPAAAYSGLLAGFWQMFMMMANTNSSMTDNQPMGLSGTSGPPTNDMNAAAACAEAFIHGLYPTNKTNI